MPKYNIEEIIKLDEKGHAALETEAWPEAVRVFSQLLEIDENPSLRNNLAYALHMQGQHDQALSTLEPNLKEEIISPYGRALASIIFTALNQTEKAELHLQEAIRQFDAGVRDPSVFGIQPRAWREYTVIIKRAAGLLADHHLVFLLHKKWERFYQKEEDLFQAGVAQFNRGYPKAAAKLFSRLRMRSWSFLKGYTRVAELVDLGLIPSFTLPYFPPVFHEEEVGDLYEELADGGTKALVLASLFDGALPKDANSQIVQDLVLSEDRWGTSFAHSILESNSVPMDWKIAAGMALIEKGVLEEGAPVIMMVDGESRQVVLETRTIGPATSKQLKKLQAVQELLINEDYDEALEILEEDFAEGNLPLEGFELLTKLYATLGDLKNTEMMVDTLQSLAKGVDAHVINLIISDTYVRLGDLEKARDYFSQVSLSFLPDELEFRYHLLEDHLG